MHLKAGAADNIRRRLSKKTSWVGSSRTSAASSSGEVPAQLQRERASSSIGDEDNTPEPAALLLKHLREEAELAIGKVKTEAHKSGYRCPLCRFRSFDCLHRVRQHMQQRHDEDKYFFCAGSRKQFRIVQALWDHAMVRDEKPPTDLIRRSASLMRASILPALPTTTGDCRLDKRVHCVLNCPSPHYANLSSLGRTVICRRVGVYLYTARFAEELFRRALEAKGAIRDVQSPMIAFVTASGSEIASLLPSNVRVWEKLLEDIIQSPAVQSMLTGLLRECYLSDEYELLTIDSTYRMMFALMGQCSYRAPRRVRQEQAFAEEETRANYNDSL